MPRALTVTARWVKDNWPILTLVLAFGLLALAERQFFYDRHPHWQIFIKEVAFAALIASFFGLTIEKYQREEFVKLVNTEREDLKRDIFLYAYGHAVPEQIREEIKERILKVPFYRENLHIEWEFSQIPEKEDRVKLVKRCSYLLMNNTAQSQEWPFRFTQISAAEKDVLVETQFDCLKIQDDQAAETFLRKDMREVRSPTEPHVRRLVRELEIGPGKSKQLFYQVTEHRRKYAEDAYSPAHPVVGRTVITIRVNEPLRLEVSAACKAEALTPQPDHDPPRRYSWLLNEGLLPFQAIAFSWSPVAGTDEPAGDAAPASHPA